MAKKLSGWKTKGMSRDLSVSAFNPEFAFENMNLRLSTNDGNTLMSWVNEKGTTPIMDAEDTTKELELNGCAIGTAIINRYLILFLAKGWEKDEEDEEDEGQYFDYIYRLEYSNADKVSMIATQLYKGHLNFHIENPIETLVSYESEHIQKVYWTDGINQPRLINVAPDNDGKIEHYRDTSFDFISTLQLNETIKVQKILGGGGMFAPGVIQYCFTYYNKYGQESNIFYTTPLYYISYQDRGGSPEDKIGNAFKITVTDVDANFDYLRIYSVQRTSINGTPICKRLQDIEISSLTNSTASYIDTGLNGDSIDPTELLYKGGNSIKVGTMEQKDNTLFLGDLTTPQNDVPAISGVTLNVDTRRFFPMMISTDNYEYASQLTSFKEHTVDSAQVNDESVPCAGFKYGDTYRCGVQFQDKTGKWTDPIFIDDKEVVQTLAAEAPIHAPYITTNMKAEEDDDVTVTVVVTNSSENAITIHSDAYIAIDVPLGGGEYKAVVLMVILGSDSSYTIAASSSKTFSDAIIRYGKQYYNKDFCTDATRLGTLGMTSNCELSDASTGTTKTLTIANVTWNGSGDPKLPSVGTSYTYTFTCTGSQEPIPEPEPGPEPQPEPGTGSITLRINNLSGQTLALSGKMVLCFKNSASSADAWGNSNQVNIPFEVPTAQGGNPHWWTNPDVLASGETKTLVIGTFTQYYATGIDGQLSPETHSISEWFGKYFVTSNSPQYNAARANHELGGVPAVMLGVAERKSTETTVSNSLNFVYATPIASANNPVKIEDGGEYDINITDVITYYVNGAQTYDVALDLGGDNLYIRTLRANTLTRGVTSADETEETEEAIEQVSLRSLPAINEVVDVSVTVPVIKGTIPASVASNLIAKGYKKARAVVVYPEMQDRKTLCQGVACPTLYTDNHRTKNGSSEAMGDLFTQSSWFFRPANDPNEILYNDANTPKAIQGAVLEYMDNNLGQSPQSIKRVEIQGHFNLENKFRVDWSALTFHSPDIEFDTSLASVDYISGALNYKRVGSASFLRTFSDIDIQTETPTISADGSGFIKKSFTKGGARGIISGLFYDDYEVDEGDVYGESGFGAFKNQMASSKWMVYLWNKNGSLNNDIERPANKGVASAKLKRKIISNLRFAETTWENHVSTPEFRSVLFNSDQAQILKLDTGNTTLANVYMGNIDTMLLPDEPDGVYFALSAIEKDMAPSAWPEPIWTYAFSSVEFSSSVDKKTFGKKLSDGTVEDRGNWKYNSSLGIWQHSVGSYGGTTGDNYFDLILKKDPVRMKYKSTPHLVMVEKGDGYISANANTLPIFELQRSLDSSTIFGGLSDDAKKANIWIPCGEPVILANTNGEGGTQGSVEYEYSWGDTYYQRWDCLKTYAFTPEDINQVVEIGSFMLETHVNIDGRYDRNRGQLSNLYMSPQNFNLINPVYSQLNNFFTYKIQDSDAYNEKYFPNLITWSKTKTSGADVDLWTNVTLASTLEMDGDKGRVRKLTRLNDQLFCFQDKGISQVLYNDNVQISSTDGVPIEIANSGKVMGKKYFSDSIGCSNKWSMVQTPSGIYFMDSINKAIFMFNGQLNNLSASLGMNTWCKDNIPDADTVWTPADYMSDNGTSGGEPINGFMNFVTYYDKLNQDVLFINKNTALAYSERLGVFTSFYDYGNSPYLCNLNDTGVWARIAAELDVEDPDTVPHDEYSTSLWKHQAGDYCDFFGESKPYWMTLIGNPEPQTDKIFTNLEFRACVDGDGEMETETIVDPDTQEETIVETGRFIPSLPFDTLETWNEYQHGIAALKNMRGHSMFKHHQTNSIDSSIIRKFRIWRCDIPRSNAALALDEGLNCYRKDIRPNDRMRNPWLYIKLMKNAASSNNRTEIHDIVMTYFD